jgi:hypothetical protein
LHAALAMQRLLEALDGTPELRIGIDTGEMVSGRARDGRSLLVEAVAHAYGGGNEAARQLEERALEFAFEGFGFRLFGPRVRLALLRDELDVVEQMIDEDVSRRGHDWMVTSAIVSTRLDALVALGRLEDVEREAARSRPAPRCCGRSRSGRSASRGRTMRSCRRR